MDIAALSMAVSQMNVGTQVSMAVTKLSMDTAEQSSNMMTEMLRNMEQSVNPNVGKHIDIKL